VDPVRSFVSGKFQQMSNVFPRTTRTIQNTAHF